MGMGLLAAGALSGLGQAGLNIGQQMVKSALDESEREYLMGRQKAFNLEQKREEITMANEQADVERTRRAGLLGGVDPSLTGSAKTKAQLDALTAAGDLESGSKMHPQYASEIAGERYEADRKYREGRDAEVDKRLREIAAGRDATRMAQTGMRVDGQLAGKSADLAARLARLNGGTGGSGRSRSPSGGGGKGDGYDKFYNEFFKADEKAGLASNDMDGFSVFRRYMAQATSQNPGANTDHLAANAIRQISNAREMATGPDGLDVKKYRQLLDALGREKNPTLQDDPTINDANVIDSALRESGSSSEQVSTTAGKSAVGKDSGSGLLGLSVGSKPTDDIYANARPDNSRLAALPGVPFAKLLDILRGRENYKALGKPFESYEDATLDWISRGEKQ